MQATQWSVQLYGDATRPAVVLLHAIATSAALWSAQISVWSQHFYLIVPDLPGHGASAADSSIATMADYADGVACLLDELRIDSCAIVGISLGGMITQTFALRYPKRVTALVLAQTMARVVPAAIAAWEPRKQLAQEQGMNAIVSTTLQRWFTPQFLHAALLTVHWVGVLIQNTSVAGYVSAISAIQAFDVLEQLTEITTPTLVVAGEADQAATPELAQMMVSRLPNARMLVLDNAAHLANIDQPIKFTEAVAAYLNDVLGQPLPLQARQSA